MRQYRLLGDVFDLAGGVFTNRAGCDRLKPTESGEFANTIPAPFRRPIGTAAADIATTITTSIAATITDLMTERAS